MNRPAILNVRTLARTVVLGALLLGPACAAQAAPSTWEIDRAHSSITFKIRHLLSRTNGEFGKFEGKIVVDADKRESVEATATIETASVNTDNTKRDDHLRSPDFFDAEQFPTMSLRSTGISAAGSDYVLHTDLTIKGVTKSVDFALEFEGVVTDPWGNTKAGFSAEAEVNRKDWGLEWNVALEAGGVLVGEKVKILLEIEALKA